MSKRAGTSLAELMGSAGAAAGGNLSLEHLPTILGDAMPELPRNAVGRHRLIRALQQRFGDNFRSLPGVMGIVQDFDQKVQFERHLDQLRAVKPRGGMY